MATWYVEWREHGEIQRAELNRRLTIGRSSACDITLDDPYVSRSHCTIEPNGDFAVVDASSALNQIRVDGRDVDVASLGNGDAWMVGNTVMRVVVAGRSDEDTTLRLQGARPSFVLRCSTRELIAPGGRVLQFSPSEFQAFEVLARCYPDAAGHNQLGAAVWAGLGFDQYQLHRLMQLIRRRVAEHGELVKAVRGSGYRLTVLVAIA